ncbi:MAG: MerR family transcriptional regulator, repressor of the yfmOP operon [Solirubrobacteraceae bacterium]|jgi:DNA-binding transcriptional MerR regulator|nr:MerR family transcriptional regulator, repressor of the yfmOP operon [Solirubrobacteraceae bacterium]
MSTVAASPAGLRIGEVAQRVGTTPRTIRYYEELGLLPAAAPRDAGRHRLYAESDVERIEQILRLKDLLGLSLDELRDVIEVEDARGALREEWIRGDASRRRREEILTEATAYIDRQLQLVARRREKLDALEAELTDKRALLDRRTAELDA